MKPNLLSIIMISALGLLSSCGDDSLISAPDTDAESLTIGFSVDSQNRTSRSSSSSEPLNSSTQKISLTDSSLDTLWLNETSYPTEPLSSPASRGSALQTAGINSFGVTCLRTIDAQTSVYFGDEQYNGSVTSNAWINAANNVYYWSPQDAEFDFYAWTPYNAATIIDENLGTFNYTVNSNVAQQVDLCGCTVLGATPNQKVPLCFQHLLSRIIIKVPDSTTETLAQGTVTDIEISNVVQSGQFSFTTGQWTLNSSDLFNYKLKPTASFQLGSELTDGGLELFLLPQTLGQGAMLTFTFMSASGTVKTYTREINGHQFLMGYTHRFDVIVTDQGSFELIQDAPIQDATYVMHTNTIRPRNIDANETWTATVSASDGAPVTIMKEADVNAIAKGGLWTDRILNLNNVDIASARGTNSITAKGSADVDIRIFIPENVGETNRIITISFHRDGYLDKTITMLQYCPDWVGDYGWEQIDDNQSGDFGFNWTRKVYLTYKYTCGISERNVTSNSNYKKAEAIWQSYGRPFWTSMGYFYRKTSSIFDRNYRCYILLDYSLLNDLTGANSRSDGLSNTVWLNNYGGDAATMALETGIKSILKTGSTDDTAFRIANVEGEDPGAPESIVTPIDVSNIAIAAALMKNRYNIKQSQTTQDAGYIPILTEIKWYLPAVDQFSVLPRLQTITPSQYWSSTANSGTDGLALDGSGTGQPRNTSLKIRACRNRE